MSSGQNPPLPFEEEAATSDSSTNTSEDLEKQSSNGITTTPPPAPEQEESPRSIHSWKWVFAAAAIFSSTFLFSLDNTVVADVQPVVLNEFQSVELLPWLGASFALGAVSILPWGKAYGVFNLKWFYIATVLIFEIGSAICGAAPNMDSMIVGRVIAGVGGSGMYVGSITFLSVMTTDRERPTYMGLIGLVWGVGTVLGPVVGGAFAHSSATWRWAFYINLPIGAIFAPALWYLPSIDFQKDKTITQKLKMCDWLGIPFFYGFMVCFIMALNFGGVIYRWSSGTEIALWVLTGVLFILFALTQHFHPFVTAKYKLYPTHLNRNLTLLNLQFQLFLASGIMLGAAYYIPLLFQFAKGDDALQAAVRLLPFIAMTVTFSMLNGTFMSKLGYYMPWYVFGGGLVLIGSALMYTVQLATSVSRIYGYIVLIGVGVGSYIQAGFAVAPMLVSPSEISDAIGFMSVAQSTGTLVFLSMAGAVFQNLAFEACRPILSDLPEAAVRQLISGTSSGSFSTLAGEQRARVADAIVESMSPVWAMLMAAGAMSFVLGCFLGRDKLFSNKPKPAAAAM